MGLGASVIATGGQLEDHSVYSTASSSFTPGGSLVLPLRADESGTPKQSLCVMFTIYTCSAAPLQNLSLWVRSLVQEMAQAQSSNFMHMILVAELFRLRCSDSFLVRLFRPIFCANFFRTFLFG